MRMGWTDRSMNIIFSATAVVGVEAKQILNLTSNSNSKQFLELVVIQNDRRLIYVDNLFNAFFYLY